MPAKLKLTRKLVNQIVELKRDGLCDADIIAVICVHPSTFTAGSRSSRTPRAA